MKQSQIVGEDLSSEPSVVSVKETTHYVESNFCKCGICEKIFFHSGTLNRHIKHVHGGEKTHSCDKCSAHYCRKEDLENHLRKANTTEMVYVLIAKRVLSSNQKQLGGGTLQKSLAILKQHFHLGLGRKHV